jgi:hypothetical protein
MTLTRVHVHNYQRPCRLTRRNERFLDLIYMRFEQSGDWPRADDLQRELLHWRDSLDVFERVERLPPVLGGLTPDSRVFLTVAGLARLDDARQCLKDFLEVLRLAVSRYRDGDLGTTPKLRPEDLASDLSLSDRRVARITKIVASCPIFQEEASDHSFAITSEIRHFVAVQSVRDYLRVLNRLERQRERKAPVSDCGLRAWLVRRQIAIWEWIAIAVAAGLIVAVCIWGVSLLASSWEGHAHAHAHAHATSHPKGRASIGSK